LDDERKAASDRLRRHLESLKDRVGEVEASEIPGLLEHGAILFDIRERHELVAGTAAGARLLGRGMLELGIGEIVEDVEQPVVLMCAGGDRSLLSAASLANMGYRRVFNLAGGFNAWREAGLPIAAVEIDESGFLERYARHLAIPEIGEAGQKRLADSHVLIVGAGGLGSPAALYLAAAGVGCLTIIDADRVERSNLQRQILHSDHLIGHLKTESAAQRLHALNPEIEIRTVSARLGDDNADGLVAAADLVVDGSDNFPTRYLLNDVCIRHRKPLVYGAVMRFSGQLGVFDAGDGQSPCYRCLFPEPPRPEDAPNCAEAGVLGVVPGVIGCLQATEALKLLLDLGEPLRSRLLIFDALAGSFRSVKLVRDPACSSCGPN
jgi:sulfur-carrier protein adenylyltransferase/sulfurtransferase